MTTSLKELEQLASGIEVVDSATAGRDNPVIFGFLETIFNVAGRVQPSSEGFTDAQELAKQIENGALPDDLDIEKIGRVFRSAGAGFCKFTKF